MGHNFSVSPVNGAHTYTWTSPTGWTGTSLINMIRFVPNSVGGAISVKSNNNGGSSNSESLNISVNRKPLIPDPIIGNTTVAVGQNSVYSINAVNNTLAYLWQLTGGGTFVGKQDTTAVTVKWTSQGSFNVRAIALNECGNSPIRTLNANVSTATAVVNVDNQFQLNTFPNPSAGVFFISAKNVYQKNIHIEVFNDLGQQVYKDLSSVGSSDFTKKINLLKQANGVYKVKITIANKIYLRSIVLHK